MQKRLRGAVLLLLLGLLVGCGRVQNERVTGQQQLLYTLVFNATLADKEPTLGVPGQLRVTLQQSETPVAGAKVQVEGSMTHAGMEPLLVEAKELEPGRYEALLDWSMAGEWIITVRATLPDGRSYEKVMEAIEVGGE